MMFRETWITIDLNAFEQNLKHFQTKNKEVILVAKANAYGHGDIEMCRFAYEHCNIHWIAVSSLDEACHIHSHIPGLQILVLGHTPIMHIPTAIKQGITLTIPSLDYANALPAISSGLHAHIKIDTGMNRLGCKNLAELKETIAVLQQKQVSIDGVFSHYACSDDQQNDMTSQQLKQFQDMVMNCGYTFPWIHIANTDGSQCMDDSFTNAIRIGLGAYGFSTYQTLSPCLSLKTKIVLTKQIEKGEPVSYSSTYHAQDQQWLATIPIGYADGWSRKQEGRTVYLQDTPATLVGRICMDQCMIHLPKYYPVGTEVELIGDHVSILDIAKDLDTIPYEILTCLSDRIPRIYTYQHKTIGYSSPRFEHDE
ncbi:MAG: alanine racemase [Erysipelotrichaceae bacterium]|nr:alanine racemase [Erysipelotrichaceae bacterium]